MSESVRRSVIAMQRKYAREVRAAVLALALVVLVTPAAGARARAAKVAFLSGGRLVLVDLSTGSSRVLASHVSGAVGLSGDGKLDAAWGATSFAWGRDGTLALGRAVCHVPCGVPLHEEVWIRRGGSLRRVAGPLSGEQRPLVAAVAGAGRALWWSWVSASTAADGTALYANRAHLADTLPHPVYVSVCGSHLAVAAGHDRYAMHGKRIVFDGRDVSRDASRSWVSPSCSSDGKTLVAAASVNTTPPRIGREHRAIWQLLPTRRRLSRPPAGVTDEFPRLLPDGSVLFVRTKSHATTLELYGTGTVELLRGGKLTP